MKKIVTTLLIVLFFLGCSSKSNSSDSIESKLVVNQSLAGLKLEDQRGKIHTINADTKKVIFAFSKDVGHECNKLFETKKASYLPDHKTQFVADLSHAPSIIRSMFILPGLKDVKHTVLIIQDDKTSATYKPSKNDEKIIAVSLNNKVITDIKYLNSPKELEEYINK